MFLLYFILFFFNHYISVLTMHFPWTHFTAFGFNVGHFNHLDYEQIYDQIIGWAFSSSFM